MTTTPERGQFFSFEGPDGSGKSTQLRMLVDLLRARGVSVIETREPGGTALGDALRGLILDPASPIATPVVMALMLSASRAQLVHDVVRPALERGEVVIVDRYADSTVAYQSFGSGVPQATIDAITEIATGGLKPDATLYLDVPPELGLERLSQRGAPNRLDAENLDFHKRVHAGYEYLIARDPGRWFRVDGTRTAEEVHAAIVAAVRTRLPVVEEPG